MIETQHLALLKDLGTDTNEHSGGELLDHLRGTHDFLQQWGNEQAVCLGGLFHSIYGTQSYTTQSATFEDRRRIRAVIGGRAERLAFLFSVTHRWHFFEQFGREAPVLYDRINETDLPVTPADLRDLIEIEVANYIEFMPRLDFTVEELDRFAAKAEKANGSITAAAYAAIGKGIADKRQSLA